MKAIIPDNIATLPAVAEIIGCISVAKCATALIPLTAAKLSAAESLNALIVWARCYYFKFCWLSQYGCKRHVKNYVPKLRRI